MAEEGDLAAGLVRFAFQLGEREIASQPALGTAPVEQPVALFAPVRRC